MIFKIRQICLIGLVSILFPLGIRETTADSLETPIVQSDIYDPLATPDNDVKTLELVVNDAQRERTLPILVYLPKNSSPSPVIIYSHGLGGSRESSQYLGKHWASRGYTAVFVQHPGSDDRAILENQSRRLNFQRLHQAANWRNYLLRIQDIPVVLDQLEAWNEKRKHDLAGRMNLDKIGMSGYSFGALTTQALGGQNMRQEETPFQDDRIDAALMLSPQAPPYHSPEEAFNAVDIPWMLMTGTKDMAIVGTARVEDRLAIFPALPPNNKYELVLDGADHFVFLDEDRMPGAFNPNHHRAILALSTAFWDAWLKDDQVAQNWLNSDQPREVLEDSDRWQRK